MSNHELDPRRAGRGCGPPRDHLRELRAGLEGLALYLDSSSAYSLRHVRERVAEIKALAAKGIEAREDRR